MLAFLVYTRTKQIRRKKQQVSSNYPSEIPPNSTHDMLDKPGNTIIAQTVYFCPNSSLHRSQNEQHHYHSGFRLDFFTKKNDDVFRPIPKCRFYYDSESRHPSDNP